MTVLEHTVLVLAMISLVLRSYHAADFLNREDLLDDEGGTEMLWKKYQNDAKILDFKKNQNDCSQIQILYHYFFFNKPKQR